MKMTRISVMAVFLALVLLVSGSSMERDASKMAKRIVEFEIEEDEDHTAPEVTIEGVLKMYLLHVSDEFNLISEYQETNYIDDYLAFVVETDKGVDVTPYIDDFDKEFLVELDGTIRSKFMIVSRSQDLDRDFASKYANQRVRATGSFYVPRAGWRNATLVVMDMKEIKLAK